MRDIFDIAPAMNSISDPTTILTGAGGSRRFGVKTTEVLSDEHLKDWNISSSLISMPFFTARGETSSISNFKRALTNTREIEVGFQYVAELPIMRVDWFKSTIFDGKRVKEYMKLRPRLAENLENLTTSVIVARGLSLKLVFSSVDDIRTWGDTKVSGSFTLFGISFGPSGVISSP